MKNTLTFTKSAIWPDNAKIDWSYDGKGYIDKRLRFIIRTNESGSDPFYNSCFVSVLEDCSRDQWSIEESPIFWNILEWGHNGEPNDSNQYHMARQAAMQWAEDYLEKLTVEC